MLVTKENHKCFSYENENARIMLEHTLTSYPSFTLVLFEDVEITENFALNVWLAASNFNTVHTVTMKS
jgi:hypothetical protein